MKKMDRETRIELILLFFMAVWLFFMFFGCFVTTSVPTETAVVKYYYCDVKNFALNTKIEISKDGEFFAEVSGNVLRFATDPLTMYDGSGNKIAYAGDSYNFINQDSHGIYVNDKFTYDMNGQFNLLGESYEIYDENSKLVAKVSFNAVNTIGRMYDVDDNVIAEYESGVIAKDFKIRIYSNCEIDDISVIMIFASYYSDYSADH